MDVVMNIHELQSASTDQLAICVHTDVCTGVSSS